MKKLARILAVAAIASMSASYAFAGAAPGTGINGTFHDISYLGNAGQGFNSDQYQRVCVFCHTPHNAQSTSTSGVVAPLWNHTITGVQPNPYNWAAPANLGIGFNSDYLIGPSRLCESCHDGSLAADAHGGVGAAHNGTTKLSGDNLIQDLTVTHPIGFQYAEAVAARNSGSTGGIQELATIDSYYLKSVPITAGTGGAAGMNTQPAQRAATGFVPGTKKISDTLYSGYMTCASCHDVHNTNNVVGSVGGYNYFLWAPEEGSAICLSCHIK